MKFCNQDISKTIAARSFKHGQLIEDNDWIIFSSYCPLEIWPLKSCNKDISKNITASSLKSGQLIEQNRTEQNRLFI